MQQTPTDWVVEIIRAVASAVVVLLTAGSGLLMWAVRSRRQRRLDEKASDRTAAATEDTRESRLTKREADHLDAVEDDLKRVRTERDEWRGWCLQADKDREEARRKLELAERRYAEERQKATECALWSVTAYEKLQRWREALLKTEPYVPENISEPPFMRRRREETPLDSDEQRDEP